ncbi:unnamed protein product [Peniophora sp. CBMAI 1063]|nr:unnamed protein product [Peniophora sp. CBMAI 1063]
MTGPSELSSEWASQIQAQRLQELCYDVLSRGSLEQRVDVLGRLQSDSEALLNVVYELRRLANACTPVCSLPLEIFNMILDFVIGDSPSWELSGGVDCYEEGGSLGWLSFSHVCTHWRAVCFRMRGIDPRSGYDTTTATMRLESWHEDSESELEDSESGHEDSTLKKWFLPFPPHLSCLGSLVFAQLSGLLISEIFNILKHAPLLEHVSFYLCKWNTDDLCFGREIESRIQLPKLQEFQCERCDDSDTDNMIVIWFLESLHFPHNTRLMLSHAFNDDDRDQGYCDMSQIITLACDGVFTSEDSLVWGFAEGALSAGNLLLDGLDGDSDLDWEQFNWRIKIAIPDGHVDLKALQCIEKHDPGTVLARTIALSFAEYSDISLSSHTMDELSWVLPNIRIIYVDYPDHGTLWMNGVLSRLASELSDQTIIFPHLERLWIELNTAPFENADAASAYLTSLLGDIAGVLRRRASHPANKLHTVLFNAAEPSPNTPEGVHAATIKSIVPNVVWLQDDESDYDESDSSAESTSESE